MGKENYSKKSMTLLLALAISATPNATLAESRYKDMPKDWMKEPVELAVKRNLLKGYGDGTIRAGGYITRSEAATILNSLLGSLEKADLKNYKDVSENKWYYDELAKAVKAQVLYGDVNKNIRPEDNITREEAFALIARIFDLKSEKDLTLKFKDGGEVGSWAKDEISGLIEAGYIYGWNSELRPKSNISRGEFVAVINRIVDELVDGNVNNKEYSQSIIVRNPKANLKDLKIKEGLIIAEAAANNEIVLDNVKIESKLFVRANTTIRLKNKSEIRKIIVLEGLENVKIILEDDSKIEDNISNINIVRESKFKKELDGKIKEAESIKNPSDELKKYISEAKKVAGDVKSSERDYKKQSQRLVNFLKELEKQEKEIFSLLEDIEKEYTEDKYKYLDDKIQNLEGQILDKEASNYNKLKKDLSDRLKKIKENQEHKKSELGGIELVKPSEDKEDREVEKLEIAGKEKLRNEILDLFKEVKEEDEERYTEDSFNYFDEVRGEAEAILEKIETRDELDYSKINNISREDLEELKLRLEAAIDQLVFKSELGGIDLEKPSEDKEEDREAGKIEIADKEVNALLEKYEKEIREQIDIAPLREIENRFHSEAKFEEEHVEYLETVVDQVLAEIYFRDGNSFNGLLEQVDLKDMDIKYVGELIDYYSNDMPKEAKKFVDVELLEKLEDVLLEKIANLEKANEMDIKILSLLKDSDADMEVMIGLIEEYNSLDIEIKEKVNTKNVEKLDEKIALLEASHKIGNLKEEDYTEASFEKVAEAHDRAETILENTEENEVAEIREAINKIEKAIDGLVTKDQAETEAIREYETAIVKAEGLNDLDVLREKINADERLGQDPKEDLNESLDIKEELLRKEHFEEIYKQDAENFDALVKDLLEEIDLGRALDLIDYYNNDMPKQSKSMIDENALLNLEGKVKAEIKLIEEIKELKEKLQGLVDELTSDPVVASRQEVIKVVDEALNLKNNEKASKEDLEKAINELEKVRKIIEKDQAETEAIREYETAIVKAESLNDLDVLREKINADERLGQEPKEDLNESLDIKEELLRKKHFEEIYKQDAENFDALVKDLLEEMDLERALDLIDYYNNDMPKQSKSMIDENALLNLEGKVKDEIKEIKELKEGIQALVDELTSDPVVASKQEVIKVVDEALNLKNNEKASKEELEKVINELEKTKKLMDLHKRIFAVKEDGNYLIENPNILGQLNIEFNELNREEALILKEAHVRLAELNDLYQKVYNNKLEAELIRSKDEAKKDLLSYVNNKYPEYRDAINKDSHVKSHIEAGLNLIDQAEASREIEGIVSDKKKLIDLRAKEILSEKAKEEAEYEKLKEEAEAAIKEAEEAKKKAEEDYNKHVEETEAPELDENIIDEWDSGIVEEGENGWDQVAEDVAILEAANEMDIKVISLLEDEEATIEAMEELIDEYNELKPEVKSKVNTENVDKLDDKLAAAIKEAEYEKLKEEAEKAVKEAEEAKKKAEEDYNKHVEETEAPELDDEVKKDMTHEDTSEEAYQKAMDKEYARIVALEKANLIDIKVLSLLEDEDATIGAMEELIDEYNELKPEVKAKVNTENVDKLDDKLAAAIEEAEYEKLREEALVEENDNWVKSESDYEKALEDYYSKKAIEEALVEENNNWVKSESDYEKALEDHYIKKTISSKFELDKNGKAEKINFDKEYLELSKKILGLRLELRENYYTDDLVLVRIDIYKKTGILGTRRTLIENQEYVVPREVLTDREIEFNMGETYADEEGNTYEFEEPTRKINLYEDLKSLKNGGKSKEKFVYSFNLKK